MSQRGSQTSRQRSRHRERRDPSLQQCDSPPLTPVTLGDLAALDDPRLGNAALGGDTERRHNAMTGEGG